MATHSFLFVHFIVPKQTRASAKQVSTHLEILQAFETLIWNLIQTYGPESKKLMAKDQQCKVDCLQNSISWQKKMATQKIWAKITSGTNNLGFFYSVAKGWTGGFK